MGINFSFDEKNINIVLDETNIQFENIETDIKVDVENQFKVKDLTDETLVKILMLKGEKGDAGVTTGASWGYITGNITDQTDLKNALNSKANKNELSTVATSGSYNDLSNKPTIPTKTSDLTNDSGFIDNSYHDSSKQDTLVSGTNIKTINNTSLLGSGNISISGGGTATDVQINGTTITSNDVANIITNSAYNSSTNKIATMSDVPTKTSDLTNDSGYAKIFYVDTDTTTYTYSQISGLIADGYEICLKVKDFRVVGGGDAIANMIECHSSDMQFALTWTTEQWCYVYYFADNEWETDYYELAEYSSIPTKVSDLTNDSGFITSYTETDPVFTSSVAHGITSTDITNWNNKSTFSGNYNDLTNKPTIPDELSDLSDDSTHRLVTDTEKSTWNAKSDFSGSYNDLSNKPTIPTKTSDLTNDGEDGNDYYASTQYAGTYIDYDYANNIASVYDINNSTEPLYLASQDDIPTSTSDLTNDSGFIDSSYHDSTKQDTITSSNKLDYALLSNTPTIPTVPTNLSSFTDDLGSSPTHTHSQYLTSYTETDPVFSASASAGITSTDINNWNSKPTPADYVIQTGTETVSSITWTYTKWNSGKIELIASVPYTGITLTSASAGTYYGTGTNGQKTTTLPFTLSDVLFIGYREIASRSSGVYVYDVSVSSTTLTTQFRAHASSSNVNCGVNYYIIGTITQ